LVVDSVKKYQNKPATPQVLAYDKEAKGKIIQVGAGRSAAESLRTTQGSDAEKSKDNASLENDLNRRKGA